MRQGCNIPQSQIIRFFLSNDSERVRILGLGNFYPSMGGMISALAQKVLVIHENLIPIRNSKEDTLIESFW